MSTCNTVLYSAPFFIMEPCELPLDLCFVTIESEVTRVKSRDYSNTIFTLQLLQFCTLSVTLILFAVICTLSIILHPNSGECALSPLYVLICVGVIRYFVSDGIFYWSLPLLGVL